MNESSAQHMKKVWQDQESESDRISLDRICERASRFQKSIWWRNFREYVGAGVGVSVFALYLWHFDTPLIRIGSTLTIVGCLYVVIQLHRRGSARNSPQDLGATRCLQFHRRELERQRDSLEQIWGWYLLPFVPGLVVFSIGRGMERGVPWTNLGLYAAIGGVLFWLIAELNKWAARKLQKQIDALAVLEQEN